MFEWSVIAQLITLASFLGTVLFGIFKLGKFTQTLLSMQSEITAIKDIAKTVADVLTTVAVQKVEISHLREDLEELKHGIGLKIS